MKKLVWVLLGVLALFFTPVTSVRAVESQRGLLLAEVQTGSASSASEEFIELYNASGRSLDLSTFRVEYFSATATNFNTPSRTIALAGTLYPNGRYLLASTGYLTANADNSFSATLAKTGGHLRVTSTINGQVIVHDLVGWGAALMPETSAAPAPNGGESLQRKTTEEGVYQDTDNNSNDFTVVPTPTPESANPEPVPGDEEPPDEVPPSETLVPSEPTDPTPPQTPAEPTQTPAPLLVYITELLPNPALPQTDANDEFIELYNPNASAVDLTGYRLETGNSFSYRYTLDGHIIALYSYLVLYSKDTGLVLSNSGGRARLLAPDGTVVSEAAPYGTAKEGVSWVFDGAGWQWSISPTAGIGNVVTALPVSAPKNVAKPKKVTSSPKPKGASLPKSKAVKQAKAKVASTKKTKAKKTPQTVAKTDAKSSKKPPLNTAILAAIGMIALTYAAYEYRTDIANQFHKLRDYRKHRGETGQAP